MLRRSYTTKSFYRSQNLQYKFMDIFYDGSGNEETKKRQDLYTGSVLSYYAACFGLRNILSLPVGVTKLLDDELKQLFRQEAIKKKYSDLSDGFSKEFNDYVNKLRGGV